jgi:hypothetical protein
VVGCGLGDDAGRRRRRVTAFDVSTAIEGAAPLRRLAS